MLSRKNSQLAVCMFCILISLTCDSFSQDAKTQYSAMTASDPNIPIEDLELLLKPLTKDELIVEAGAWMELLKEKVEQISNAEIQVRQETRQIEQKEDDADQKPDEAEIELRNKTKEQLLMSISKLSEQKKTLIDRINTVLAALKAKGGDIEVYEQYVAAVSGSGLAVQDLKDASGI